MDDRNTNISNEKMTEDGMTANSCFFLPDPCLEAHLFFLTQRKAEYVSALQAICDSGVVGNLSQPTKARVLAALQISEQHSLVESFLRHCDVVEVTKCCQMLDRPRLVRQLEQKISSIEQRHPQIEEEYENKQEEEAKIGQKKRGRGSRRAPPAQTGICEEGKKKRKTRRVDVYRTEMKNQLAIMKSNHGPELPCVLAHKSSGVNEMISSASLSGAFAKKVRRWARELEADFLEFIILSGSFEYWKTLADLVHFSPKDFALPYFLSAAHGGDLPKGTFVAGMKALSSVSDDELASSFKALAKSHPTQLYKAFNFLRTQKRLMRNREIVCMLAENIALSSAVWYLEELAQVAKKEVTRIVSARLRCEPWMDQSSKVTDSFGKLLERILTFRTCGWNDVANELIPAAERRLAVLREAWSLEGEKEGLTVIFGDKSYSMTLAIRAATILAAMVSACFDGELSFFDHDSRVSPHAEPKSVKQVLGICQQIRASGGTSLAAALLPYYVKRIKVERIILVTDEEENTPCMGLMFAKLLAKYKEEVHGSVELIIVCVGKGDDEFRRSLKRNGINSRTIEVDGTRPDLSKFDSLLNQIALVSMSPSASPPLAPSETTEKLEDTGIEDFVLLEEGDAF